jgi:hypothetical protein
MCDQDDVWLPTKLERMSREFVDPDVMAAIHSVTLVDSEPQPLKHEATHWYHNGVYQPLTTNPSYLPYGMSMLARRNLFTWIDPEHMGSFESATKGHDRWTWFLAATLGKIVGVQDRLALYRQHTSNLFGAPPPALYRISIRQSRKTGATPYEFCAERAAKLAEKLDKLSPDAPLLISARSKKGSHQPKGQSPPDMKMAISGGYGSAKNGGLGTKSVLKDFYSAILQSL